MNYNIETTDDFDDELKTLGKKYPSLKMDFQRILDNLEKELLLGIDLGAGFKKIRINIKSKGKGKRGGGRVIVYETIVAINDLLVVFVSIYNKGDFDTVDINILKKNLGL
jgi:mRNA-degrading endonuclease RelE of RelBE toxin-antitoxin system